MRGQDIENGGHFKELYCDGKFNQYINKKVLGAFCFPSGIKLNMHRNEHTAPSIKMHTFSLTDQTLNNIMAVEQMVPFCIT